MEFIGRAIGVGVGGKMSVVKVKPTSLCHHTYYHDNTLVSHCVHTQLEGNVNGEVDITVRC